MREASDPEQLGFAQRHDRVLYTFNVGDFCRLHASHMEQGSSHAGIVVAQQKRYSVGEQMRRLLRLIAVKSSEEMRNSIEFLSTWG